MPLPNQRISFPLAASHSAPEPSWLAVTRVLPPGTWDKKLMGPLWRWRRVPRRATAPAGRGSPSRSLRGAGAFAAASPAFLGGTVLSVGAAGAFSDAAWPARHQFHTRPVPARNRHARRAAMATFFILLISIRRSTPSPRTITRADTPVA